jgi:SOS-response transcriptional repressor LexA
MDTLAKRLRFLRKERGLNQETLAQMSGLEQSLISKLERGVIQRTTGMVSLAQALRCRPEWLDSGDGPIELDVLNKLDQDSYDMWKGGIEAQSNLITKSLIEDIYPVEFSIPLLSWVRAGAFCEAPGSFTREDAQELLPRPLFRTGPNTFALTVVGDSMDVPDGYREGEIVYIDPDIEPTPGKDVLAKADGKMTLKRYKVDDEGPYLLQLNGNRIIRPTDWSVCGVVVYAGRRC